MKPEGMGRGGGREKRRREDERGERKGKEVPGVKGKGGKTYCCNVKSAKQMLATISVFLQWPPPLVLK